MVFKDSKQNIFTFNYNFQFQIELVSRKDFFPIERKKNSCYTGRMDILPDLYFFHVFLIQSGALLNTSNSCSYFWYSLSQLHWGWIFWKAQEPADWSFNLQSTRIILNQIICINELKWYLLWRRKCWERSLNILIYSLSVIQEISWVITRDEGWYSLKLKHETKLYFQLRIQFFSINCKYRNTACLSFNAEDRQTNGELWQVFLFFLMNYLILSSQVKK